VCRQVGVPVSTHYARKSRTPSLRELQDRVLIGEIHRAREGDRRVYGVRKTWRELGRRGVDVGRDRVARLMRQEGLEGVRRGKKHRTTTPDEAAAERARDLVQRDFTAERPNELWVADITYVRSWNGFVYLAFILDVYARMIVGWQIATHMRAELVLDALEMANGLRQPAAGLVAHSDRGSQSTSLVYTDRLDELGIAPSVGSKGDALDNAMAEAWVATYKNELINTLGLTSVERIEHDPRLDQLLQQREAARRTRRHPAERVRAPPPRERRRPRGAALRAADLQDRNPRRNEPVRQITTPPTNPGRIKVLFKETNGLSPAAAT